MGKRQINCAIRFTKPLLDAHDHKLKQLDNFVLNKMSEQKKQDAKDRKRLKKLRRKQGH